jgi:hypothetical protein
LLHEPPVTLCRSQRNRRPRNIMSVVAKKIAQTIILALPLTATLINTYHVVPTLRDIPTLIGGWHDSGATVPDYSCTGLTHFKQEQLRYDQEMDSYIEAVSNNPDDKIWCPALNSGHKVIKFTQKGKLTRTFLAKVHWMNDAHSWVAANAVWLQSPFVLVDYAIQRKLLNHPDWQWVSQYAKFPTEYDKLARAFRVSGHMNSVSRSSVEHNTPSNLTKATATIYGVRPSLTSSNKSTTTKLSALWGRGNP